MVEDEARVGVAVDQRHARVHVTPAQHVDRQVVPHRGTQEAVEARGVRLALRLLRHHDADAIASSRALPWTARNTGV